MTDGTLSAAQLPPDYHTLFDAVVAQPGGIELLRRGHLESVSALFGTRPALVDEVRGWLGSKPQRKLLAEALLRARGRRPAGAPPATPSPVPVLPPAPRSTEELLRAAREVPGGEEFLSEAPLETVAIVFGVRPALVAQARERLGPRA